MTDNYFIFIIIIIIITTNTTIIFYFPPISPGLPELIIHLYINTYPFLLKKNE